MRLREGLCPRARGPWVGREGRPEGVRGELEGDPAALGRGAPRVPPANGPAGPLHREEGLSAPGGRSFTVMAAGWRGWVAGVRLVGPRVRVRTRPQPRGS